MMRVRKPQYVGKHSWLHFVNYVIHTSLQFAVISCASARGDSSAATPGTLWSPKSEVKRTNVTVSQKSSVRCPGNNLPGRSPPASAGITKANRQTHSTPGLSE